MSSTFYLLLPFLLSTKNIGAQSCDSFSNNIFEAYIQGGDILEVIINGCITEEIFDEVQVTKLSAKDQSISSLNRNSVNSNRQLTAISFNNTSTAFIENGALTNVPNLRQFQLTYNGVSVIHKDVFANLALNNIFLNNNEIMDIEQQAFANLKNLQILDLSFNALTVWNPNWFTNSPRLHSINAKLNKIRIIPRGAFQFSRFMKTINFMQNDITVIEKDAFAGLSFINDLELSLNKLKLLNPNSVPNRLRLKALYLSGNKLTHVAAGFLNKIAMEQLLVGANPLKCNCLEVIKMYCNEKGIQLHDNYCSNYMAPNCIVPKESTSNCLEEVDEGVINDFRTSIFRNRDDIIHRCPEGEYFGRWI